MKIWNDEMWGRAKRMRANKWTYGAIGDELGLTEQQVQSKFLNELYRRNTFTTPTRSHRPSSEILAARDQREAAADRRTQTQQFFGDPPPGYSALDRKNARHQS